MFSYFRRRKPIGALYGEMHDTEAGMFCVSANWISGYQCILTVSLELVKLALTEPSVGSARRWGQPPYFAECTATSDRSRAIVLGLNFSCGLVLSSIIMA